MSLSRQRQQILTLIGCISLLVVLGCGRPQHPVADVQGVLTFEGNPLAGYSINFLSAEGEVATGVSDEQGHFTLKTGDRSGAPVGECKVYIQEPRDRIEFTDEQVENASSEDIYKMQHAKRSKPRDEEKKKLGVPVRYNTPEKSGLKFTVDEDEDKNVFELNLTK